MLQAQELKRRVSRRRVPGPGLGCGRLGHLDWQQIREGPAQLLQHAAGTDEGLLCHDPRVDQVEAGYRGLMGAPVGGRAELRREGGELRLLLPGEQEPQLLVVACHGGGWLPMYPVADQTEEL